jgi:hypothetical protein
MGSHPQETRQAAAVLDPHRNRTGIASSLKESENRIEDCLLALSD